MHRPDPALLPGSKYAAPTAANSPAGAGVAAEGTGSGPPCPACGRPEACCADDGDVYRTDAAAGGAVTYAVVPLSYGRVTVGALWVALPDGWAGAAPGTGACGDGAANGGGGGGLASGAFAGSADAGPGAGAGAGAECLLRSATALQQLSVSASMALAAGADDPTYLCWLAGCLQRLAGSGTLAELLGVLCGAMAQHVQRRFLLDAAAQAALVPSPGASVGFMLRPEGTGDAARSGGGGSALHHHSLLAPSTSRLQFSSSVSSMPSTCAPPAHRQASATQPSREGGALQRFR